MYVLYGLQNGYMDFNEVFRQSTDDPMKFSRDRLSAPEGYKIFLGPRKKVAANPSYI